MGKLFLPSQAISTICTVSTFLPEFYYDYNWTLFSQSLRWRLPNAHPCSENYFRSCAEELTLLYPTSFKVRLRETRQFTRPSWVEKTLRNGKRTLSSCLHPKYSLNCLTDWSTPGEITFYLVSRWTGTDSEYLSGKLLQRLLIFASTKAADYQMSFPLEAIVAAAPEMAGPQMKKYVQAIHER